MRRLRGFLVCSLTAAGAAAADPLTDGYAWLRSQQDEHGAFGAATGEQPTVATHEAIEALIAGSQSLTPETENARLFLALLPPDADHELALRRSTALHGTPFSQPVSALVSHAAGFAALEASVVARTLLALHREGRVDSSSATALGRSLAALALPSGCFAYADNDPSAELTALVVRALRPFPRDPAISFPRAQALNCLVSLQQPGGGFGTIEATAAAAIALLEADLTYATALAVARGYLIATQHPDGSWGGVRVSALALQALGGAPDWEMTPRQISGHAHIFTSALELVQGEQLTGFAQLTNRASSPAPAAPLRVRAYPLGGGAAVHLADFTVPALQPGQTTSVPLVLPTNGLLGRYRIEAEVDVDRLLPELDRTNNVGIAYLNVVFAQDLAVTTASVSFVAAGSTTVSANIRVRNLGSTLGMPVPVELRRGSVGGPTLGSFVVPSGVVRGGDFLGSVSFSNAGMNGFSALWVVVDPNNVLAERNEENNVALRFYENGAEQPIDLQLLSSDFAIDGQAVAGRLVTLRGVVRNLSAHDANRFLVTAFDTGGLPVASVELEAARANSHTPVSLSFLLTGSMQLTLIADANHQLNDVNRINNTALFGVSATRRPADLVFNSLSTSTIGAQNGQPITLIAGVRNAGDELANTSLRVTEEGDGVSEVTVMPLQLAPQENRTLTLGPFITPSRGSVYRVCLDPFEVIEEVNEHDNCVDLAVGQQTTNVSLNSRDIGMSPVGAAVGEKVSFTATVRNSSANAAQAVVEWWQGAPGFPYATLLAEQTISIPANGSRTVSHDLIRNDGIPEVSARLSRITPRNPSSNLISGGRHFFLQEVVDLPYAAPETGPFAQLVRVGRLTGQAAPELVLALERNPSLSTDFVVMERSSGKYEPLWTRNIPGLPGDIVLIDLERDGPRELVAVTVNARPTPATRSMHIRVLNAAGVARWATEFPIVLEDSGRGVGRVGLVDYNGDGVVDVVSSVERLRVQSGIDGALLLDVNLNAIYASRASVQVVDVTSDGEEEFLITSKTSYAALYSHQGLLLWERQHSGDSTASGAVLDMNFDGQGELVESGLISRSHFTDLGSATAVSSRPGFVTLVPVIGGALRQDGLAYAVFAPWNAGRLVAVRGDFTEAWSEPMRPTVVNSGDVDLQLTLADLEGRGRPQLIGFSCYYPFMMVDGRTGQPTIGYPDSTFNTCSRGGLSNGNFAFQPPVVADLTGDGQSSHVVMTHSEGNTLVASSHPQYGRAEALIFHSPRWKKMPPTWPTHSLVKGRIGDDLKLAAGPASFSWWQTHNTYNQQFDLEPAKLLPDFVLAMPAQGPATANQTFSISATLKNEGGLSASNVSVAFWDGHPSRGGIRLGASTVAGPLAVRTGQAPVTFAWSAWPEGRHELCAVANEGGVIDESGDENNIACVTVLVRAPQQSCDLELVTTSLAVAPQPAVAGDLLALSATVRNIGALSCSATFVVFADGVQAPSAPLGALAPGASASVLTHAVAFAGAQTFTATVDPELQARDGDRSNNVSTVESHTAAGNAPELRVASVVVNPAPAFPGEAVELVANVQNTGASASHTRLQFQLGPSTLEVDVPPLGTGELRAVTAVVTAGIASQSGIARVDALDAVSEVDETNNTAPFTLLVVPPLLSLSATATPGSAGPDSAVGLSVAIANSAPVARELMLSVELIGSGGASVALVADEVRAVVGTGQSGFTLPWNTGRYPPGAYILRTTARENGRFIAAADAPVTVLPELGTDALIAVDRGTYAPRETVLLIGRAVNASRNLQLVGASVTTTFVDASGVVVQSSTRPLTPLPPLGHFELSDAHVLSPMASPGTWRARLVITDSTGGLLASAEASYQVQVVPARSVVTLTTVQPVFPAGPPLPVHVDVTNTSSVALTNAQLQVQFYDLAGPTLLPAESGASMLATVAAGGTAGFDFTLPTLGVQPGPKLLVTRVDGEITERLRIEAIAVTDHDPPVIVITGISDGEYTGLDVTPVITIFDASTFTAVVTLDGQPFPSGTLVTAEGPHTLQVSAVDFFGNAAFRQLRFTIDKTPPVISLGGVLDGEYRAAPTTLTFSATDASPTSVTSTLNGLPFQSVDTVSVAGAYVWVVTATDAAGNVSTAQRSFVLDFAAPIVTIFGVDEGAYERTPVTLTWTVADASPVTVVALLDGVPSTSNSTVNVAGPHVLVVTATDAAGNAGTATRNFTLDFTPPVITVAGVTEGAFYANARTITFSASDENSGTTSATLDGVPFASGGVAASEGPHTLVVTATDRAGNSALATVHFTVDQTPPAIIVAGVNDGQLSGTPLTITYSATDANLVSVTATLDGTSFPSGSTTSTEGPRTLQVIAVDAAGNVATRVVAFRLDFTAPVITISGVVEGQTGTSFTPAFAATDTSAVTSSATLDGAAFVSGTAVTSVGAHTLIVTATDAAGNSASRTVHFVVVPQGPADPPMHFAACGVQTVSVSNSAQSIGSLGSNGTVTLRNSALIVGSVVAGTDLSLQNSAHVTGFGRYGRNLSIANTASLQGGALKVTPAPAPCTCSYDVDEQLAAAFASNDNAQLSSSPNIAQYLVSGGLEITNGGNVVLPGGTYYLTRLRVRNVAELRVAVGATARLFVEGDVTFENSTTIGGPPSLSGSLLVVSGADVQTGGVVQLQNSSEVRVRIYAPKADVELQNSTRVRGGLVGRRLDLGNSNVLTFDGTSDAGVPLVCP